MVLKTGTQTFSITIFLGIQGGSCRNSKTIANAVKELQGVDTNLLNKREKLHRKAVVEWANEDKLDACRTWEEILLQYPRDTMAIIFSYYGYILSGQSRMLRDSLARLLPFWRESDFHYGYLQGKFFSLCKKTFNLRIYSLSR